MAIQGGPGGREVDRVSVRVVPDVTGFYQTVKKEVQKVKQKLSPIELELKLGREQLQKDLAELKAQLSSLEAVVKLHYDGPGPYIPDRRLEEKVHLDYDKNNLEDLALDAEVTPDMGKVDAELERDRKMKVKLDPDTSAFMARAQGELAKLENQLQSMVFDPQWDRDGMRADINANLLLYRNLMQRGMAQFAPGVKINPKDFAKFRTDVRKLRATVDAQFKDVTLKPEIDRKRLDAFRAEVEGIKRFLDALKFDPEMRGDSGVIKLDEAIRKADAHLLELQNRLKGSGKISEQAWDKTVKLLNKLGRQREQFETGFRRTTPINFDTSVVSDLEKRFIALKRAMHDLSYTGDADTTLLDDLNKAVTRFEKTWKAANKNLKEGRDIGPATLNKLVQSMREAEAARERLAKSSRFRDAMDADAQSVDDLGNRIIRMAKQLDDLKLTPELDDSDVVRQMRDMLTNLRRMWDKANRDRDKGGTRDLGLAKSMARELAELDRLWGRFSEQDAFKASLKFDEASFRDMRSRLQKFLRDDHDFTLRPELDDTGLVTQFRTALRDVQALFDKAELDFTTSGRVDTKGIKELYFALQRVENLRNRIADVQTLGVDTGDDISKIRAVESELAKMQKRLEDLRSIEAFKDSQDVKDYARSIREVSDQLVLMRSRLREGFDADPRSLKTLFDLMQRLKMQDDKMSFAIQPHWDDQDFLKRMKAALDQYQREMNNIEFASPLDRIAGAPQRARIKRELDAIAAMIEAHQRNIKYNPFEQLDFHARNEFAKAFKGVEKYLRGRDVKINYVSNYGVALRGVVASEERAKKFLQDFVRSSTRAFAVFRKMADLKMFSLFVQAGQLRAIAGGIISMITPLTSISYSLRHFTGALALIPTLGGGAVAAIGSLAWGFAGLGEAIGETNLLKLQDQLDNMGKRAGEVVMVMRELEPVFLDVKKAMQDAMFVGVADQIRRMSKTFLPELKKGLISVGGGWNFIILEFMRAMDAIAKDGTLAKVMAGYGQIMKNFGATIQPQIRAFNAFNRAGTSWLVEQSKGWGELSRRFAEWSEQAEKAGDITRWLDKMWESVVALGKGLWSLVRIFGAFGKAAEAAGGPSLKNLADGLERVANSLNSPTWQKPLTEFFSGMKGFNDEVAKAGPAFRSMMQKALPAMGKMAKGFGASFGAGLEIFFGMMERILPALGDFMEKHGPAMAKILRDNAPLFMELADEIAKLFRELGNMDLSVIEQMIKSTLIMAKAFVGFYTAAIRLFSALSPIIAPLLAAFNWLTTSIVDAATGAVEGLAQIVEGFKKLFSGNILGGAADLFIGAFKTIINGALLIGGGAMLMAIRTLFGKGLLNAARTGIAELTAWLMGKQGLMETLKRIFAGIGPAISGPWRALWTGLRKNVDEFVAWFRAINWAGMLAPFRAALTGAANWAKSAWATVTEAVAKFIRWFKPINWDALFAPFRAALTAVANWAKSAWATVKEAVAAFIRWFQSINWGEVWAAMSVAAAAAVTAVLTFFTELPGKLWEAAQKIWAEMWKIGEYIIGGFLGGMLDGKAWNGKSFKQNIVDFFSPVTNWVKNIFDEHSPSRVFADIGSNVVLGFALGVKDEMSAVRPQILASFQSVIDAIYKTNFTAREKAAGNSWLSTTFARNMDQGFAAAKSALPKSMERFVGQYRRVVEDAVAKEFRSLGVFIADSLREAFRQGADQMASTLGELSQRLDTAAEAIYQRGQDKAQKLTDDIARIGEQAVEKQRAIAEKEAAIAAKRRDAQQQIAKEQKDQSIIQQQLALAQRKLALMPQLHQYDLQREQLRIQIQQLQKRLAESRAKERKITGVSAVDANALAKLKRDLASMNAEVRKKAQERLRIIQEAAAQEAKAKWAQALVDSLTPAITALGKQRDAIMEKITKATEELERLKEQYQAYIDSFSTSVTSSMNITAGFDGKGDAKKAALSWMDTFNSVIAQGGPSSGVASFVKGFRDQLNAAIGSGDEALMKSILDNFSKQVAELGPQLGVMEASLLEQLRTAMNNAVAQEAAGGAKKTVDDVILRAREQMDRLKKFGATIANARAKGLDKTWFDQIMQVGPFSDEVDKFADLSDEAVAELNKLAQQMRDFNKSIGTDGAEYMFRGGMTAAEQLIAGLKSQEAALTAQLQRMLDLIEAAMKQATGITIPKIPVGGTPGLPADFVDIGRMKAGSYDPMTAPMPAVNVDVRIGDTELRNLIDYEVKRRLEEEAVRAMRAAGRL